MELDIKTMLAEAARRHVLPFVPKELIDRDAHDFDAGPMRLVAWTLYSNLRDGS